MLEDETMERSLILSRVGVVVVVLAVAVGVLGGRGEPPQRRGVDRDVRNLASAKRERPTRDSFQGIVRAFSGEGLRDPSDEAEARGLRPCAPDPTAGAPGTLVYQNAFPGVPFSYATPGVGVKLVDDMQLAGTARAFVGYDHVCVYQSSVDNPNPYDVRMVLRADNGMGTAPTAEIPGTECLVAGLPPDTAWNAAAGCPFGSGINLGETVWLEVTFSTNDAGWVIAQGAELGITQDVVWIQPPGQLFCYSNPCGTPYAGHCGEILAEEQTPNPKRCIYRVTCEEGSDCPTDCATVAPGTLCQTTECEDVAGCAALTPSKCGAGNCCAGYKLVECRVPAGEPACPTSANACECPKACTPLPATETDDVRDYACRCYDRLGITPNDFVNNVGWQVNCKTGATPLHTTVGRCSAGTSAGQLCDHDQQCPPLPAPADICATRIQAKDCTGIPNCDEPGAFPTTCDRPAWLEFAPQRCYGNTYIRKWEITASKPRPGKTIVTVALLCRHKKDWSNADNDFNDIAMIMHNNDNGETCWFQSPDEAPNDRLDGAKVPAPHADDAPYNATTKRGWHPPTKAANINCIHCHDNGPWMNSRWMFHSGIELRDGLGPYINDGFAFKDWNTLGKPKFVTVDDFELQFEVGHAYEKKGCTSCHKIHSGETDEVHNPDRKKAQGGKSLQEWINFTIGRKSNITGNFPKESNARGQAFDIAYWMPTSEY
jgi:hypothetical protein